MRRYSGSALENWAAGARTRRRQLKLGASASPQSWLVSCWKRRSRRSLPLIGRCSILPRRCCPRRTFRYPSGASQVDLGPSELQRSEFGGSAGGQAFSDDRPCCSRMGGCPRSSSSWRSLIPERPPSPPIHLFLQLTNQHEVCSSADSGRKSVFSPRTSGGFTPGGEAMREKMKRRNTKFFLKKKDGKKQNFSVQKFLFGAAVLLCTFFSSI